MLLRTQPGHLSKSSSSTWLPAQRLRPVSAAFQPNHHLSESLDDMINGTLQPSKDTVHHKAAPSSSSPLKSAHVSAASVVRPIPRHASTAAGSKSPRHGSTPPSPGQPPPVSPRTSHTSRAAVATTPVTEQAVATHQASQHYNGVHTQPQPYPQLQPQQHTGVPHLDGGAQDDAAAVLEQLRGLLSWRASALVTSDETGPALTDLVSVLLLLGEDLAAEEPGVVTLFQPVIDIRLKLRQFSNQHVRGAPSATAVAAAAAALGVTSQTGSATAGQVAAAAAAAATAVSSTSAASGAPIGSIPSLGSLNGSSYVNGTSFSSSSFDHQHAQGHPTPAIAALVTKARCPRLVAARPVSCIASTLSGECAQVAGSIAKTVMTQGSTSLRVTSSAEGLIAAWRALRAARMLVRAQGQSDIVIAPACQEDDPPEPPSRSPPRAAGGAAAPATGAANALDRPEDGNGGSCFVSEGLFNAVNGSAQTAPASSLAVVDGHLITVPGSTSSGGSAMGGNNIVQGPRQQQDGRAGQQSHSNSAGAYQQAQQQKAQPPNNSPCGSGAGSSSLYFNIWLIPQRNSSASASH